MIITNRPAAFLAGVIFAGLILTGCATRSAQPATAEAPPAESPASSSIDGPLGESLTRQYMAALTGTREESAAEARLAIVQSGDTRFVAVFLELMRARLAGIVGGSLDAYVDALQSFSGESFGADWTAWVVWYGGTDLVPPPGFTGWKGRLLGRIDDRFAFFLRDGIPSRIRTEEIQWGGVRVDGVRD